jgi:tRNA A37 methylthiotransferase MiaB
VLNSSSTDQWLRKEISNAADQTNGLDINLDTILSNYQFVKTECFSYDDSGFATAESTKDDINYTSSSSHQQQQQQLQQPPPTSQQSTGVTTTTNVLLENNLSASSDLISYTDMTNNNNEWNIDRNGIKEWETCEANVN